MPLIDHETVQRITDAADIVEVVGDYVHLVRRGANYMGLCPFHNERTPSFSVNKRKNFCYCFSCKQGGSPVNFIMKKEGISYHEALLHLAKKYGIEVRQRELSEEERREQTEREAMFVANEWAMLKMKDNLFNTEEGKLIGLSYFFTQRGITKEACDAFRLGYALDRGQALTDEAKRAGLDIEVLKKTGLIGESHDGRLYDKYRGRVIFPILNTAGKIIGFGGRTLKNDKAKYINSPESEIYKKSNELYGIFQARSEIGREDKCYLVEGYFDVIGMWQSGMKNVVASSGTALTDGQINLIHRFTKNITLIYDGDKAGIKAALRGVDMLLHHNMKVKVLILPDGDDPDSFARKHTPEEFKEFVLKNETDVIAFKAKVLVDDIKGDPQGRITAVQDIVTTLAHISDPISRDVYVQECSKLLNVPEETILKSVIDKRSELAEGWRKDRIRKELNQFAPSSRSEREVVPNQVPSGHDTAEPAEESSRSKTSEGNFSNSPLFVLEKHIMEFIVRYGYVPFCRIDTFDESETEAGDVMIEGKPDIWWNVLEYVDNELGADSISFSYPVFRNIIEILKENKSEFEKSRNFRIQSLDEEIKKKRDEGILKISQMDLSVSEIRSQEKILEEKLDSFRRKEILDYEKNYVTRFLASHENEKIREISTALAIEKHQLSNIYYRDNNVVETEEDRLDMLVPRALDELKGEILNLQVKELFARMASAQNPVEELEIQQEINDKIRMRAILAKNLGERIVSPEKVRKI